MVIMAIGQKTNLKFITEADGIKLTPRGLIESDAATKDTSVTGVFAGGDVRNRPLDCHRRGGGGPGSGHLHRPLSFRSRPEGRPDFPLRPIPKEQGHWNPVPEKAEKRARAAMATLPVEAVDQELQRNQPGVKRRRGRGGSGPLHQLRDLLRMHAVRGGLSGRGHLP